MKPMGDHQVPSFKVESRGTSITYASPTSGAASLDFLAHTLRARNAHTWRTILICQQNCEAERLKLELAERDCNTILLPTHDPMARQVLLLWSKGYIHQALILCDDMLEHLEGVEAHLVVHTTLPELNKFEERMEWLSRSAVKAEVLVITAREEEENKKGGKRREAELEVQQKLPPKDIKPVVKVDPLNTKHSHETEETMSLTSAESDALPIAENGKEHQITLSMEDTSSNSLEKLQLRQASFEVKNTDLAVDESSLATARPNAPGDAHLSAAQPSEASEAEFQEWLKARKLRYAAKDLDSPPAPSVPLEEPPCPELPDTTTSDVRVVDDTASLDSFQTVEDSAASLAVEPFSAAGTTVYNYGVLAWSRHLVVPCYDLGGAPDISTTIGQAMHQLGVAKSRARAVQRFAWPHVSSGKSVVVVGNMQIGKTWSYLPTVCQRSHKELQCRPADGHGPSCIFVCPNQSQGKQIGRWMSTMFRSLGSEVAFEDVVTHWDKSQVADIVCRLSRPVGILLTSVDLLFELLSTHNSRNAPIFDAQAVKCIALDNLNDMVRLLPDVTTKLLKRLPEVLKLTQSQSQSQTKCNLYVSGRIWHTDLMVQRILPLMRDDVLILFDDALEASVYGGVQLDIKLVQEEEKIEHLKRLFERTQLAEQRAVVVCSSAAEVLQLRRRLDAMGLNAETCVSEACYANVAQWRRQSTVGPLLVTDDVVPRLRCGQLALLVHYSLASSWMRFKQRFSLFYESLKAPALHAGGQSVIFVQATDVDSIWILSDFLLKHKLPRPIHLLAILSQRRLAEPQHPGRLKLCRQLTAFGDCLRHSCTYRHVMWRHEVPPPAHYPTAGPIRFSVLACHSPASLSVRLGAQFPTVVHFLNVPMTQLGQQVQRHYEVEEHRRRHPNPVPGERAVVKNINRYERADVVSVENNGKVVVQLLDTSTELVSYNASQLYACDAIFKDQPREAMEVRITGLEPQSLDRLWPEDVRNVVRKQFFNRRQNKRNRQFYAVVQATIQQTIFVRDVHDEEGNDLRSFVTSRFRAHQDERCLDKLAAMVQGSRDFPQGC
ncbi:putative ATP-dependent RNA helicase SoYb [Drosophila teissieri]|uniref:putative ATP-dependent RNA helicase SoYb n=1 Tax=Drosophila teissieri TaxID=7243 RepID=UPI001CBA4E13|nr:putative ATP-dependent RNA helicase SoYb [Drosophila teissieri]